VTITRPGGSQTLPYRDVRAKVSSFAARHSVRFLGVKMQSRFGPIALDDTLFVNGRNVAAAIVRGMTGARERRG
jgi:hypothetical protein